MGLALLVSEDKIHYKISFEQDTKYCSVSSSYSEGGISSI